MICWSKHFSGQITSKIMAKPLTCSEKIKWSWNQASAQILEALIHSKRNRGSPQSNQSDPQHEVSLYDEQNSKLHRQKSISQPISFKIYWQVHAILQSLEKRTKRQSGWKVRSNLSRLESILRPSLQHVDKDQKRWSLIGKALTWSADLGAEETTH